LLGLWPEQTVTTIAIDLSGRRSFRIADYLNRQGALPLGVSVRPGFRLDGRMLTSIARAPLTIAGESICLCGSVAGFSTHGEVLGATVEAAQLPGTRTASREAIARWAGAAMGSARPGEREQLATLIQRPATGLAQETLSHSDSGR